MRVQTHMLGGRGQTGWDDGAQGRCCFEVAEDAFRPETRGMHRCVITEGCSPTLLNHGHPPTGSSSGAVLVVMGAMWHVDETQIRLKSATIAENCGRTRREKPETQNCVQNLLCSQPVFCVAQFCVSLIPSRYPSYWSVVVLTSTCSDPHPKVCCRKALRWAV